MANNGWQPIETAPMDGTEVLLFRPSGTAYARIVTGKWDNDAYARNPRPYWAHTKERIAGKAESRGAQPTHWMPLPAPPTT